jgi:hypothetical protein
MPYPPTPSQTASNTPTPSITPSLSPTITPSVTTCPSEQLITYGSFSSNSCGNFSLTGYTSYIQHNSVNYLLDDISTGFGDRQLGDCITILYPYVGLIYRFDFIMDPNLSLCSVLIGSDFNRVDYEVISFDGIISGIPTYTITERYYLNGVLVDTLGPTTLSIIDQVVQTCNVNVGGIYPEFRVQIGVTQTPSATPTMTPTIPLTPSQTPSMTATNTATPSNTPSVSPTTTTTLTPSPSATRTTLCYEYYFLPDFGQTIDWLDCSGNYSSASVSGGVPYYIPCAQQGTINGSGIENQGASCI